MPRLHEHIAAVNASMQYEADEVAHQGWEVLQTILGASVGYLEAKGKGNKEIAARHLLSVIEKSNRERKPRGE